MRSMDSLYKKVLSRPLYLYGDTEIVRDCIAKYSNVLDFVAVVSNLDKDIRIQEYASEGIETLGMDDARVSPEAFFIICDSHKFLISKRRMLYISKAEYEDFISFSLLEAILQQKKLMLCMGTSLVRQVSTVLSRVVDITKEYNVVYFDEDLLLQPYSNLMPECRHLAKFASIYIYSSCEKIMHNLRTLKKEELADGCMMISVSDYGFSAYFPNYSSDRNYYSDYFMREYERKNANYGLYFGARDDEVITRFCQEGKPASEILKIIKGNDLYSADNIMSLYENQVIRWKTLEEQNDVTIRLSEYIKHNSREKLCINFDEWDDSVITLLAERICELLNISSHISIPSGEHSDIAIGTEIPVYRSVRNALDMKCSDDRKYRVVTYNSVRYLDENDYYELLIDMIKKAIEIMRYTGMDKTLREKANA